MKKNTSKTFAALISLSLLASSVAQPAALCAQVARSAAGRVAPAVSGVPAVSFEAGLSAPALAPDASLPALSPSGSLLLAAPSAEEAAPAVGVDGVVAPTDAETSEAPEKAPAAPSERKSLVSRLASAVSAKLNLDKLFDSSRKDAGGMNFSNFDKGPVKVKLPKGAVLQKPLVLDKKGPVIPTPARQPGFTPENDDSSQNAGFEAAPFIISADAASNADIERAVRSYIDRNTSNYNGVTSAMLQTVDVQRLKTIEHQTDTVIILMRQQQKGMYVHGTRAEFTIKLIKGKLTAFPAKPLLYGNLAVDTDPVFSDDELRAKVQKRLGIPPQSDLELDFVERKIVNVGGAWHTANIYVVKGMPVMVAVDVVTGKVFAWDPRASAGKAKKIRKTKTRSRISSKFEKYFGQVLGHAETDDHRDNGLPILAKQPLALLEVTLEGGRKVVTDENGKISISDGKPVKYTALLEGKYAKVHNASGKPLQISGTFVPGEENIVYFNKKDASIDELDQVNAYVHYTKLILWNKAKGINDTRLDFQMDINVNIDDECNAYYTPGRPSLNFFKASANCSDTGRPGVIYHEGGHGIDDAIGGILNGALSEGWGDIMSMYILGTHWLGEGFILDKARAPYPNGAIRDGENTYQYGDNDEVHDQGQAWMGFGWKLRKALIASLGAAAGAVMAEALVLPTLYAKATTIPEAIAQVLLNDMDKNGAMPHEKEIRAAAQAHNITLPKNPGLFLASFVSESILGGRGGRVTPEVAGSETSTAQVRAKLSFSAGALVRGQIANEIRKFCDLRGLKYDLKEYRGVFSSDFLLVVEGSKADVSTLVAALKRLGS